MSRISLALILALMPLAASAQSSEEVAREFYARLDDTAAPTDAVVSLIAPDFVDHDRSPVAPAGVADREVFAGFIAELRTGFPGMTHEIDFVAPLGEDRVVVRWTFDATHDGSFFGISPTGRAVTIDGVDVMRIEDGTITELWHVEEPLLPQITG